MTTALNRILSTPLKAKGRNIQVAADGYAVAAVNTHMNDVEAYATMFAAAPEMVNTLRVLIEQIENTSAWEDAEEGNDDKLLADVNDARALLAKAEGQSNG